MLPTNIIKRNGKSAPFEPSRIRKAIYGAFWEFENNKTPGIPKGSPLSPELESAIDKITEAVVENVDRKNLTKVEEIESQVEDMIWNNGYKDVSKLYIGYRTLHQKKREESERMYKITVVKSSGEKVPFQIEPLERAIAAACAGLKLLHSQKSRPNRLT
jgi:anaerobic ribonucleoside-triphosphate reductase